MRTSEAKLVTFGTLCTARQLLQVLVLASGITILVNTAYGLPAEIHDCKSLLGEAGLPSEESPQQISRSKDIPWPAAPPELIESLRAVATNKTNRSDFTADLNRILAAGETQDTSGLSPSDRIIHAFFSNRPFEEIKEAYAIDKETTIELEGIATLTIGRSRLLGMNNLGQALASAVGDIKSDFAKLQWIRFLMKDGDTWVQYNAVKNISSLQDTQLRDELALKFSKHPDHPVRMGIAAALPSISIKTRWAIIKDFIQETKSADVKRDAQKALASFPALIGLEQKAQSELLQAWYEDVLEDAHLQRLISAYEPSWQKNIAFQWNKITEHDWEASLFARDLLGLKSLSLYQDWIGKLKSLASSGQPTATFASDILAEIEMRRILYDYQKVLQEADSSPDKIRPFWIKKLEKVAKTASSPAMLNGIDGLIDGCELDWRLTHEHPERKPNELGFFEPSRDAWTPEAITEFENAVVNSH